MSIIFPYRHYLPATAETVAVAEYVIFLLLCGDQKYNLKKEAPRL
jgi:hypothetical protein